MPNVQIDALLASSPGADSLLRRTSPGWLGFRHRLIAEFLVALRLRDDPEALGAVAHAGNAFDAIGLALSMTGNPSRLLVSLASHLGLDDLGRVQPYIRELPSGALDRARTALVGRVRFALGSELEAPADWPDEDIASFASHDEAPSHWPAGLLHDWDVIEKSRLTGWERGKQLEQFIAAFFGEFFRVVERNCHTHTGELDLVLEIRQGDPFWAEFGALIIVECKNTRKKTQRPHIDQFLGAHSRRRTKLAFFVSQAGFTRDAMDAIRATAGNRELVLVVPITGGQIRQSLIDREAPDRFFRRLVRSTSLVRIG